jgi:hypothetical protein
VDGQQLLSDKKKLLDSSFDDSSLDVDPTRRRKSGIEPEAVAAAHSAVAVVAAQAKEQAAKTDDVMEQLKADLVTQRVELQVLKENVAFQSRRMSG